MRILVLNPGSSSLKYRLYEADGELLTVIDKGVAERLGEGDATPVSAAKEVIAKASATGEIAATGYRVVHGGARYTEPTRLTEDVLAGIRALGELAPLHNPVAADVIAACRTALPDAAHVAVFDTAFHRTLPPVAYTYAIPHELTLGETPLRRYGFHGIAHQSVCHQLQTTLGGSSETLKFITCHLGNGASVCAINGGKSVDTSMGLTPLEGLVMGTRSGDVDPGLLIYLLQQGKTAAELDDLLNHESGLKGISGLTSDVRDLEKAAAGGDANAQLAVNVFAYRVAKYIGAYAVALGGADALAFSGGIGEHSAAMRARIVARLAVLSVALDPAANEQQTHGDALARISAEESGIAVYVTPVDEEGEIARAVRSLL